MNTTNDFIFLVSSFVTLFLGALSYLCFRRHQQKELGHLAEFWFSLAGSVLITFIFRNGTPQMMALSMLGWLWPLRTFRFVLQDLSGQSLIPRWQYLVVAGGVFISVALGGYGFPFMTFTIPMSLVVGGLGLATTVSAYKKTPKDMVTPLYRSTFFSMGLFFVPVLTYPFWRLNENFYLTGLMISLFAMLGLAGSILSSLLEIFKKRTDLAMETMGRDRNEKLLGQSKYSELGMMSAGIAHEINNPLAVIQARTTQLLRMYKNPQKQQELADGLQQILYTSERINRTIQGIREFVHQDDKGPLTEIPLKTLIDDVLAFTGQRMKNHGVSMRFYGLEDLTVVGNKIQLEQILLNLINNSFDAIEFLSEKWIEISAHPHNGMVRIYFKDSGIGIPDDIAARMMDPFFTTKEIGKGTGLGLALASGIAQKHGGSLQYMNNCVHTTFMLELPRELNQQWMNTPRKEDKPKPLH